MQDAYRDDDDTDVPITFTLHMNKETQMKLNSEAGRIFFLTYIR